MSGSERSANALIRWLEVRTDDLLELHWAAVEAVASALITKHILDAKEFIEAFELAKFPTRE